MYLCICVCIYRDKHRHNAGSVARPPAPALIFVPPDKILQMKRGSLKNSKPMSRRPANLSCVCVCVCVCVNDWVLQYCTQRTKRSNFICVGWRWRCGMGNGMDGNLCSNNAFPLQIKIRLCAYGSCGNAGQLLYKNDIVSDAHAYFLLDA